jgi:tripartite-type tricarboxylate transporter receptor subunit TctC
MEKNSIKTITYIILPACAILALPVVAQSYPVKPLRLVVGFPPGGGTDTVARLLAPKMAENLGQNLLIDNRPGANTNIANEHVAKSAADGYTLLLTTNAIAINMSLYKNVRYDAIKDFSALSMAASSPLMLVVHPALPVKTVGELVKLARARPGQMNYSSSGGPQFLATELLKIRTKTDIVHVPYSGSGQSLTALISGEVQMTISNMPTLMPHVTAKKLRPLAVASATRSALVPEIPTLKESGVEMEVAVWYGLFVPASTPREIQTRLTDAAIAAAGSADFRERLARLGAEAVGSTQQAFAKQVALEVGQWAEVVRISGAKPD